MNSLRRQLRNRAALLGDGVSRAFLRALVQLIGGYRDALKFHLGQKITFSSDAFIESRPSSMQPFLRKMLQLQIFQQVSFVSNKTPVIITCTQIDLSETDITKHSCSLPQWLCFLCTTSYLYSYSPDFTVFVLKIDRKNASWKLFLLNFSFRNSALYVYLLTIPLLQPIICDWLFYSLLKRGLKCWIMDLDFLMSLNWKLVTIQRNQAPNWNISTRSGHMPCGKKAAHS